MAKVALNKGSLQREREHLKLYQRVLPSLDLKRQQLTLELSREREQLNTLQNAAAQLRERIAQELPMLANREIPVSGLVVLRSVSVRDENLVGVKLPLLTGVDCTVRPYSMLAKPHWVDVLVVRLQEVVEARLKVEIAIDRVQRLDRAVRRTTQRVNLFDKILIPNARRNIRRIQIFLGDAERAAIVRSKLAKAKRREEKRY